MTWTVRSIVSGDAAAVADVFRRSRAAAMPWLPVLHSPDEDDAFFAREVASSLGWVAIAEGGIVGFALARAGWLNHLYVMPEWHGRGISSELLRRVQESHPGATRLWAFQRNSPAIEFYEHRGFVVAECTDGSANEEREPDARLVGVRGVRPGVPADAESIARVHTAAWQSAYPGLLPDDVLAALDWRDRVPRWREQLTVAGDTRILVVEVGDRLAGFCSSGPARDEDLPAWFEVYSIYVAPDGWRAGAGSRLLAMTLACLPRDVAGVALWVLEGNARARAFYEGAGFRPDGRRADVDRAGHTVPSVRYVRAHDSGI